MNKIQLLATIAAVAVMAACEPNRPEGGLTHGDNAEKIPDSTMHDLMPSDTLFYLVQGFNKNSDGCVSDTADCASFKSSFPVIEARLHGQVSDSVNNFIRQKLYSPLIGDKPANGINDLLAPYFEAYEQAKRESSNRGENYTPAWFYSRYFTIQENTPRVFTLVHTEKSYAGGAHPNHFTNYYHFNPATGGRITTDNIFKPGYKAAITKMAEKKFLRKMQLTAGSNLEEQGFWFKDNKFVLPNNFYITENGIKFFFNPYEVAAYAVGKIEMSFTFKEVEGWLRDEFNPVIIEEKKQKEAAASVTAK
jgi:hypothetical protein